MKTVIAISAFCLISLVLWFETRRMISKKRMRFTNRPDLSPDESQREFHASDLRACEVQEVLREISEATDIPIAKLRPTDRFDLELAPAKGWELDDGLGLLPELLKDKFGGVVDDYDLRRSPTIEALLSVVARVRLGAGKGADD